VLRLTWMMQRGAIVVLGNLPVDSRALEFHAGEFGWSLRTAENWVQLRETKTRENIVAVLFDATLLGVSWTAALEEIARTAPEAKAVVCPKFSDAVDWPSLVEAGAFHLLARPLEAREVRQSLGFIWASKRTRPTTEIAKGA
jgi:DNA-binding NtrC family response regulator